MSEVKPFTGAPLTSATQTVLGRLMKERRIRTHQVGFLLGCSDRSLRYYFERARPVPLVNFGAVCDLLDVDQEDLIEPGGLLRLVTPYNDEFESAERPASNEVYEEDDWDTDW